MKWKLLSREKVTDLNQLEEVLLQNRNITEKEDFFQPKSPFDLEIGEVGFDPEQFSGAVERIKSAIENKEKILVFGDYDADGICATATLWTTLDGLGAKAFPFIPNRERHGYGISIGAIDEILQTGKPDLVITVDNGIVAFEAINYLIDQGVEVIITDHHQPEFKNDLPVLPKATFVVYSTKLCGASVAWTLARELDQNLAEKNLDLVGIATIADQVPLVDANRSFAKFGIEALQRSSRPGLLSLLEKASVKSADIDSTKINFVIAPRINAMGRLEDGLDALRLLCTNNQSKADQLADLLDTTNDRRKDLTYDMLNQADDNSNDWDNEKIIIVYSDEYHEGVIGLIAGRLCEKYYKPAIAISISGDTAKASARSVAGVNIVKLIRQVKADLLAVGGHPMAAGFGVELAKMEMVIDKLRQIAQDEIDQSLLEPVLEAEATVDSALISLETLDLLSKFEPFGQRNSLPLFQLDDLEVIDAKPIGKEQNHLRLLVRANGQTITCLGWRKAHFLDQLSPGDRVNLLANLQLNEWNGRRSVQLVVEDLHILS